MNIVFDHQIFSAQKYGGISRYFVELAIHLKNINDCNPQIIAPFGDNIYLDKLDNTVYKKLSSFQKKINKNQEKFIENEINSFSTKDSILHETYYLNKIKSNHPYVTTIHDMIYEIYSSGTDEENFVLEKKKESILHSSHIICVSKSTKNDLLQFYPQVKDKVSVIYHGVSPIDSANYNTYSNKKPYILYVGQRNWYKNFFKLLSVYIQNNAIHSEFDLICFGGSEFNDSETKIINAYNFSDKVIHIKGDDSILNSLYKGASVLAYLSTYEGFGFPVLEAMMLNCPVICSKFSSLPEVAGNAACLIDTSNEQEIVNSLNDVLFNNSVKQNLIEKGKEQAGKFTWQNCANKTHALYTQLLK